MKAVRKIIAKMASPLDRYVKRRMTAYIKRLEGAERELNATKLKLEGTSGRLEGAERELNAVKAKLVYLASRDKELSSVYSLLFTVVIPAYNVAEYITECLDSVVASMGDSKDTEILVIDDGSTDNTGYIVDEYAKKCSAIRAVHQANQGLAVVRNLGIMTARGEYMVSVDGDDLMMKEALPSMRECILKWKQTHGGNEADLIPHQHIRVYPNGETIEYKKRNYALWQELPVEQICAKFGFVTPWNFCIRVQFLRDKKLYFEPGILSSQDLEWMPRMFLMAQSVMLNDTVCYRYRISRPGSLLTTMGIKLGFEVYQIFRLWRQKFYTGEYTGKRLKAAETYMRRQYAEKFLWIEQFKEDARYGELLKDFESMAIVLEGSKDKADQELYSMIKEHGIEYAQKGFPAIRDKKKGPSKA